ncbi:MAG TPA: hypothetical protein DDX39_00575 [Bacteroidales bacterium]|nr:MAG: hypothetical protein A2W98_09680 [Bacteroidetes bacterium GWF2_33_38]OFY71611.1 MAG: hypothetical protein A2265_01095 [Bacteroidetes bacterium RIFOXYA12_FULL_33_9]OFY91211.1 MAG: hypothetical protein A2236_08600 [Bacteroidetes bacterium RIFOXYA2_FULL_33_7]HBF87105.1 hypothetical protein [Bacteroidales bacterium]
MDKNFKNIEDLYKQKFKDLEVVPTDRVWNTIDNRIWLSNFRTYFNNLVSTSSISVSAGAWAGIARKLWLRQFLMFNPAKFNVYYLSLLLSITATYFFYPQETILNSVKQIVANEKQTNIYIEGHTIQPEKISENQSELDDVEVMAREEIIRFDESTAQNNTIVASKSIVLKPITLNNTSKFDTIISHEKISEKPQEITTIFHAENTSINKFDQRRAFLLNDVQINKNVYQLNDDTLGVNYLGNPIIRKNSKWSLDLYGGPLVSNSILFTQNKENQRYIEARNEVETPVLHYSAGLNLNYKINNIVISSGLSVSEIGETYNYKVNAAYIDTLHYFTYQNSGYMQKDTISYLNMDSLMVGDTSYVYFVEYNWVSTYDSVLVVDYDTIKTLNTFKERNKYRYVEIPLMFGFEFEKEKYSCTVSGGLITGILYKTQGLSMDKRILTDNVSIDDKRQFVQTQFSLALAVGFAYKLNNKFSLLAEPYFRKTINSIYPEKIAYLQKYNSYGMKVGIRYRF